MLSNENDYKVVETSENAVKDLEQQKRSYIIWIWKGNPVDFKVFKHCYF